MTMKNTGVCVTASSIIIPQKNKLVRIIYLLRIKKMEARNAASFGTSMGKAAHFESWPTLPHGLTGSFISHTAVIGKDCVIMQNVTIGSSKKRPLL